MLAVRECDIGKVEDLKIETDCVDAEDGVASVMVERFVHEGGVILSLWKDVKRVNVEIGTNIVEVDPGVGEPGGREKGLEGVRVVG